MVSPRPYGLHVISGVLTDNDIKFIASVIHRFLTFKEASQLDNVKQVYDLPDGGYFIVQDMGGVFRVLADKQQVDDQDLFEPDGLFKFYIPMFFSGVIERSLLLLKPTGYEKVKVKLTEVCRHRLRIATELQPPKEIELERLSIEQSSSFPEFLPLRPSTSIYTQYRAQNHAWYKGSMAALVQFVGGYGRQDMVALPDTPFERASIRLPAQLRQELVEKYVNARLPGYMGVPPRNGQFQFDYKAKNTEAVCFDREGKPWLVRVSHKVWAMPLPVIPVTSDPLFHSWVIDELGDSEMMKVLERFKALPSGEGFPTDSNEFQAWVRAGVIIEICNVGEFYSKMPMFEQCGWSFNLKGDRAYNTAWGPGDNGVIECGTYRLTLDLQATPYHYSVGEVQLADSDLSEDDKLSIAKYMTEISKKLAKHTARNNAIKYKLRHVPFDKLLERTANQDFEQEVQYWDTYQSEPIAQHKGNVVRQYVGNLYHHEVYKFQPQIKFPDYQLGMCVSFDFSPFVKGASADCDTIMYAYFDENTLKVVKYFYLRADFYRAVETDFEEPMTVGSWYKRETTGRSRISGNFYTTDLDDREEVSPTVTETKIVGQDKGFDSTPFFEFMHYFAMQGTLWRHRYYTHHTKTVTERDKNIEIGILVPMFNTNAVLYANRTRSGTTTNSESLTLNRMRDPHEYKFWTYDAVFAWNSPLDKQTGRPYPSNGNPVWVEYGTYKPTPTNDFADQGHWISGFPQDYTWLIHPNQNEWQHSGGGGPPPVRQFITSSNTAGRYSGDLYWQVSENVINIQKGVPHDTYFTVSPDDLGNSMIRMSSRVSFGDAEYANISETNQAGFWKYTGYSHLVNHSRAYHFIGVINE
ncbi:hypothetical protein [Acinetobacter colistiniresistens]|uniref:hypothetical protein n=1 Tax=Acinetobacter colistiniresistens TaxID=280145 RepID=UPI002FDF5F0E